MHPRELHPNAAAALGTPGLRCSSLKYSRSFPIFSVVAPSMRGLFVKSLPDAACFGPFHCAQGKPPLSRRRGPAQQPEAGPRRRGLRDHVFTARRSHTAQTHRDAMTRRRPLCWRLRERGALWLRRTFHPCRCAWHRTPETSCMKPGSGFPFLIVGSAREPRRDTETRTSLDVRAHHVRETNVLPSQAAEAFMIAPSGISPCST
jgi:hypothetical protein